MFNPVQAYNVNGMVFLTKDEAAAKMIQGATRSELNFNECKKVVEKRRQIIKILQALDEGEPHNDTTITD